MVLYNEIVLLVIKITLENINPGDKKKHKHFVIGNFSLLFLFYLCFSIWDIKRE